MTDLEHMIIRIKALAEATESYAQRHSGRDFNYYQGKADGIRHALAILSAPPRPSFACATEKEGYEN